MKGRISSNGALYLLRGNSLVPQECIYNHELYCSDRCAHFGEPELARRCSDREGMGCPPGMGNEGCDGCPNYQPNGITTLTLCNHKTLEFTDFSDAREVQP